MSAKQVIDLFRKEGIHVLEILKESQLVDLIKESNNAYYNTNKSLMTDNEYDIVKEFLDTKFPKNELVNHVGAPVSKNKVKLPYNMPSMDKIKPDTNALLNWKKKYNGPCVISCKLDGVSGMYVCDDLCDKKADPKLYTRGDGYIGQDVSHLLDLCTFKSPTSSAFISDKVTVPCAYSMRKGVKKISLPNIAGFIVRGEFIIPKKVFDEKYKSQFANPRNLVSGIINSKTMDEKVNDLHFVAYEIIQPFMKPSQQMNVLKEFGFEVVQNRVDKDITNESLSNVLSDWRNNYMYEIDGIIVNHDCIHMRKEGNPDYAFAFKMVMSDQMAEAKVLDVIWEASKAGYLKPRVRIEPVRLGGVTIEYATGFNGKFIEENKIGIGSVIQIIRSGDVIPYIKSITTPAETPKMPSVPYHWTDTHVDVVLDEIGEDMTVREKNITAFFTTLEVDGLSTGNVKRIMLAGFDTIPKILNMKKSDYMKIPGFKDKMVDKISDGIQEKVKKAGLVDIMVASNLFGRGLGEKKISLIMGSYPNILSSNTTNKEKIQILLKIQGIGPETASSFVENISAFLKFLKECDLEYKLGMKTSPVKESPEAQQNNHNLLYKKRIVMTKTRDPDVIEKIKKNGALLDDNIGKNTDILIVKTKEDVSNKVKYALEHKNTNYDTKRVYGYETIKKPEHTLA